jgi:hypothetical protein
MGEMKRGCAAEFIAPLLNASPELSLLHTLLNYYFWPAQAPPAAASHYWQPASRRTVDRGPWSTGAWSRRGGPRRPEGRAAPPGSKRAWQLYMYGIANAAFALPDDPPAAPPAEPPRTNTGAAVAGGLLGALACAGLGAAFWVRRSNFGGHGTAGAWAGSVSSRVAAIPGVGALVDAAQGAARAVYHRATGRRGFVSLGGAASEPFTSSSSSAGGGGAGAVGGDGDSPFAAEGAAASAPAAAAAGGLQGSSRGGYGAM